MSWIDLQSMPVSEAVSSIFMESRIPVIDDQISHTKGHFVFPLSDQNSPIQDTLVICISSRKQ